MDQKELSVFPMGEKNDAFAQYFTGQSYMNMLSTTQVGIGNVTHIRLVKGQRHL